MEAGNSETGKTEKKTSLIDYASFYQAFQEISRSVHSSNNLRDVLDLIVVQCAKVFDAKGAFLRLHNEEKGEFELAAAHGMGKRYQTKGPVSSKKIFDDQGSLDKVHIITDVFNAPRIQYPREAQEEGIRMILDVPLNVNGRMVGLLRLFHDCKREFSEEEQDFLLAVAEQCAWAIKKTRTFEMQKAQYNQLAIQTEKLSALGRMAAGIAHEINNPLAAVLLFSSNIIKKVPDGSPLYQGLEVIIRETQRCKGIIENLLEFSRENIPSKVVVDVNQVIEQALTILENEFILENIHLEKQLSEDLRPVLFDVNQLVQVFVNLLLNAIQAIGQSGQVTVASWFDPKENMVRVSVRDNGCGIQPEFLPKVFEPFFSTKSRGTGLGLAVSYGIVENHQGTIGIESQPGAGTLVTMSLPAARNQ